MADQRRRSFDDVLKDALGQWTTKFEGALEEQRQVIEHEAQQRSSEIELAALEYLEVLEKAAAEKTAEIRQAAGEHREATEHAAAARSAELEQAARRQRAAFDDAVRGRASELDALGARQTEAIMKVVTDALQELEQTASSEVRRIEGEATATRDDVRRSVAEGAAAFDEFAGKRLGELEDSLRGRLDSFRRELIDEAHRVRDITAERVNETRSLVTSIGRRLEEQAAATHDDMRRIAAEEAAAFDELARERVAELRDVLRNQTELLGEFTRVHGSTSNQLDEVRALATVAMDRLSELGESAAAAAEKLKLTSAKELNSIQQRAIALDELARKHIAEIERAGGELLEAETSTAEGLRELERQLQVRRAEIETLGGDRIAALTQDVHRAEGAVVQRITELEARAEDNAQALDARLAQATEERAKELERQVQSRRVEVETLVDDRIAAVRLYVQRAEATVVQRIAELEGRAEDITQALDARLAPATDERAKALEHGVAARASGLEASLRAAVEQHTRELKATGAVMKNELRDGLRADASAAQATDARMAELAEMIAAARIALDQVVDRVDALEARAGALADGTEDLRRDLGAVPQERGGRQARAVDGAARGRPKRSPANTPDRRGRSPLF